MEFAAHGIDLVPWYPRLLGKVKLMVLPLVLNISNES